MKDTHDIVGFWLAEEIVCLHCISKEEKEQSTTEDDIIYRENAEEFDSFCDRCERPLIRDS